MLPFVVRRVRPEDLDACHRLEQCCFPPAEAASREKVAARIERFPEAFLVAEADGVVVGQVSCGATHKDDITDEAFKALIGHHPDGRNLVVFTLTTDPGWRKRGVASALMARLLADARARGRARVLLLCKDDLKGFYQGLGFADGGLSASTHGGTTWSEMRLDLG
ncbi:N-acetyltransferase [Desulfocurvus sp.]|jgi:ribosomal protein S18 acetylase RimI-like enzyme|uniref:GNAT family N-acetyltransferase n=1 Tax=Desulfocurvus sp. TaxID=2871698 RepID=UPI0025BE7815|nr:N-acetyltransferase [Desulfocurvus sp.]MCK9239147.1 GNAT family N-acetyltransferase [Desulfocurvus sp.]